MKNTNSLGSMEDFNEDGTPRLMGKCNSPEDMERVLLDCEENLQAIFTVGLGTQVSSPETGKPQFFCAVPEPLAKALNSPEVFKLDVEPLLGLAMLSAIWSDNKEAIMKFTATIIEKCVADNTSGVYEPAPEGIKFPVCTMAVYETQYRFFL